ncbi:MqnA/MqnD/SBP family protein [Nitrosophilus alvini]|uniref:MqnA/MqnD/SBP family protein n=1 Tax=Nitrosophilus alvini TaxID=2714855 RepID=UPI00190B3040|nr:MqnA/MqnD/SBP family protein [Nitrosophilus alvini]
MIFAKIDYINLLPLYLFLKKYIRSSATIATIEHKKGVPSQINISFKKRKIDAAIISSVESKGYRCTDLGIVANKKVLSVLVCEGENREDIESNTSNVLAKILELEGEVLIGDKALKKYFENCKCKDLAEEWYNRYKLPFVFARLCFHSNEKFFKKMSRDFLKRKVKIPQYILKKYAKRSGLTTKQISFYLKHIDYKIDAKAKKSLKKFIHLSKKI